MKPNNAKYRGLSWFMMICLLIMTPFFISCGGSGGGGGGGDGDDTILDDPIINVMVFEGDQSTPAGSGVKIRIDGADAGTTDANGTFTTTLESGTHEIFAFIPNNIGGSRIIEMDSGDTHTINIFMEGGGLVRDATVIPGEIQNDFLDIEFDAFSVKFNDNEGNLIELTEIYSIHIDQSEQGIIGAKLKDFFSLQPDGSIVAEDLEGLRAALTNLTGEVKMVFLVGSAEGIIYEKSISFQVGRYRIEGTLSAPPSNPGLSIQNIKVKAKVVNTGAILEIVSDSAGNFEFDGLPAGALEFDISIIEDEVLYRAIATVTLDRNKKVTLTLLSLTDITNGVSGFSEETLLESMADSLPIDRDSNSYKLRELLTDEGQTETNQSIEIQENGNSISVETSGGEKDAPMIKNATITVPKGTEKVELTYWAQSAEYPVYVQQQSVYDDQWWVWVQTSSSIIFYTGIVTVNSQLHSEPLWQSNGRTMDQIKSLDVSALTTAGDTKLSVVISSKNVGDRWLPTYVKASLAYEEPPPKFILNNIIAKSTKPTKAEFPMVSIPNSSSNEINFEIRADLINEAKHEIKQENITVELIKLNGDSLLQDPVKGTIDITPGGDDSPWKLKFNVNTSGGNFAPPPPDTDKVKYKITVSLGEGEEKPKPAVGETEIITTLWRMPPGFEDRRTGRDYVDAGGDDWCRVSLYNWISTFPNKITRLNDISVEHAQVGGHRNSHEYGLDLDMFHFKELQSSSGRANFKAFQNAVTAAISEVGETNLNIVKDFISTERSGLTELANDDKVALIYVMVGDKIDQFDLPSKWAWDLLKTGKLKSKNNVLYDIGAWDGISSKIKPAGAHDDHYHVEFVN